MEGALNAAFIGRYFKGLKNVAKKTDAYERSCGFGEGKTKDRTHGYPASLSV